MNGFHVHAIGWILICNARAFSAEEARSLTNLWEKAISAHAEDVGRASAFCRLMQRRSIKLSGQSLTALAALVRSMLTMHAERFEWGALRSRRNSWLALTLLGFALSVLSATLLPNNWPLMAEIVPTLFLLGCISMLPAVLLWRAASAVRWCCENVSDAGALSAVRREPNMAQTDIEVPNRSTNDAAGIQSQTRTRI